MTSIITQVSSPIVNPGEQFFDTASVTRNPTILSSSVTFRLFGPDVFDCSGIPIQEDIIPVSSGGSFMIQSSPFSTTVPGVYRYRAFYAGNAESPAASTMCNDPNENVQVKCFLIGTHILTPRGEIPVEKLSVGDYVSTYTCGKIIDKPIKNIVEYTPNIHDTNTIPIKICRSALKENVPKRNLYVSPKHGIYIQKHLIRAHLLVNDETIYPDHHVPQIKYYHIELENHALLVAEGVYAESYLNKKKKEVESYRCAKYVNTPGKAMKYIKR